MSRTSNGPAVGRGNPTAPRKTFQSTLPSGALGQKKGASPGTIKTTNIKAASAAGENPASGGGGGVTSAYAIMASRIANRVAEMAESITFVERPRPNSLGPDEFVVNNDKKRPRKLEMRLDSTGSRDSVSFSAPFLDNTLQKMLNLQNRMLKSTADLTKSGGRIEDRITKEHAAQSAELSRIIALICAEKARQGV